MPRIGRADIEEASRAVNVSSRARQLCYPRGNFSVGSETQIIVYRGSLCPCFHLAITFVIITIRQPFAITLFMTFLPPLRSSLGGPVIFSGPCHPSTTAHLHVSPKRISLTSHRRRCSIVASTTPGEVVSQAPAYALYESRLNRCRLQ